MANNAFGIDLGTNNIKIYNRNDDNIMIEKYDDPSRIRILYLLMVTLHLKCMRKLPAIFIFLIRFPMV